jgi:hypothetical protein
MKKPPVDAGTFCPMQEISSGLWSKRFRTVTGNFRKSLKLKMLGKTAGDSPHREGKSRT